MGVCFVHVNLAKVPITLKLGPVYTMDHEVVLGCCKSTYCMHDQNLCGPRPQSLLGGNGHEIWHNEQHCGLIIGADLTYS